MKNFKKISKYLIIVFIGTLLGFFVSIQEYSSKDLSASVLSLTEQDFFESTSRDIGYKKEKQIFEVFLSKDKNISGDLSISILYAPHDVELFLDQITSNYQLNIKENNTGNVIISINGYEGGDLSEGIFQIPFSGNSKDLTLEYVKSKGKEFSIGSLDNIENTIH